MAAGMWETAFAAKDELVVDSGLDNDTSDKLVASTAQPAVA